VSLTQEQVEFRRTGVGSSEIGSVAGLTPPSYTKPIDVWAQKLGLAVVEENEAMRWGTRMEPIIASAYAAEHCAPDERLVMPWESFEGTVDGSMRHPTEGWILASPDRVVEATGDVADGNLKRRRLVEIKNVSSRAAHYWGDENDDVPPWYRAQIEWQMLVTGVATCDLAALIGGSDFRVYRIERDPDIAAMLVEIGRKFWRCVETRDPPPLDGSDAWKRHLEERYARSHAATIRATRDADEIASSLAEAKARQKAAKVDVARYENELRAFLGEYEIVEGDDWRATWRAPEKGLTKWKEVATELGAKSRADIVAKHTGAPSRRLTFTWKGENDDE
jgi:putative phage-type endonuclease